MRILVIDYKMNNLGSISRALEECGATVIISDDPAQIKYADKVVLPGVGSFAQAMANLAQLKFIDLLYQAVIYEKKPILGICLGMQLLADYGSEGGNNNGLGLISGKVVLLDAGKNVRLPHMGWNDVAIYDHQTLFKNIPSGSDFYFVHSYHVVPTVQKTSIADVDYGQRFTVAVQHENIFGVQFHPEKSSTIGFQVLRNFLVL